MVVIPQMVNADVVLQQHALEICQYAEMEELQMLFAPVIQEVMDRHLLVVSPTQHADQTGFVL